MHNPLINTYSSVSLKKRPIETFIPPDLIATNNGRARQVPLNVQFLERDVVMARPSGGNELISSSPSPSTASQLPGHMFRAHSNTTATISRGAFITDHIHHRTRSVPQICAGYPTRISVGRHKLHAGDRPRLVHHAPPNRHVHQWHGGSMHFAALQFAHRSRSRLPLGRSDG